MRNKKRGQSEVKGIEILSTILVLIFLVGGFAYVISNNKITGKVVLDFDNVTDFSKDGFVNLLFEEAGNKTIFLSMENSKYSSASFSVLCKNIGEDYSKKIFIDVLDDGYVEYDGSCFGGRFVEFKNDLNAYVANCGFYPCEVPIKVGSSSKGEIILLDLDLEENVIREKDAGFSLGNAIKGFFNSFKGITGFAVASSLCANQTNISSCLAIEPCIWNTSCFLNEAQCSDLLDNNNDSFVDCCDNDCSNADYCFSELNCTDLYDNDCDGFIDCDDSDCAEGPACQKANETIGDFGDAPDSTNHLGANMTAYPGANANYPTVFDAATGMPQGPCHNKTYLWTWLGNNVSAERDADLLPDDDNIANLNVTIDSPDQDLYDDGLNLPLNMTNCTLTNFTFNVTVSHNISPQWGNYSFYAWFDWNRDGDWDDNLTCFNASDASELAVNQIVWVGGYSNTTTITFATNSFLPYNPENGEIWMRMTLEPIGAMNYDGSGPGYCFEDGETEDYYLNVSAREILCVDNDVDGYNQSAAGCGQADCNDANASIRPGALEICNNSVDDDCDSNIDCNDGDCSADPACAVSGNATYNNFNGTDFNNETDIHNVSNATLENSEGGINWEGTVNASGRDFDSDVIIGSGFISVNVTALGDTWNSSANITMSNACPPIPFIYYSAGTYASRADIVGNGSVCNAGSDPACTNIRCEGSDLKFTVSHFTGFAAGSNSNLTIWDDTDYVGKNINDQIGFYANYTNATGGPINGSNVYCEIKFNLTGSWQNLTNMTFNASSRLYEYNRSFSLNGTFYFNVLCNGSALGHDVLNVSDDFVVGNDTTNPIVTLISPPNNTIDTDGYVVFTYNVTDNSSIANCSVVLNGVVENTETSITKDINQTIDATLANGVYDYSINCTDVYGNEGASDEWVNLTVNVPSVFNHKALIVWGDNTNVPATINQYRIWNGSDYGPEKDTIDQSGTDGVIFVEMDASPVKEEAILAFMDGSGGECIHVQVWNGTAWGNNKTFANCSEIGTDPNFFRSLDVEYYNNSHALVVWFDKDARRMSHYAIWDGTQWIDKGFTFNATYPNDPVQQELGCDISGQECVLVQGTKILGGIDQGLYAQIWNGTAWGYNITILDGTSTETRFDGDTHGIDIEYDLNGNAMVIFGHQQPNKVRYIVWNSTSKTWGSIGNVTTALVGDPYFIELTTNPNSNEMAMAAVDAQSDIHLAVWNTTDWINQNDVENNSADRYGVDTAYDVNGNAMFVWNDYNGDNANNVEYIIWNGTWGAINTVPEILGSTNKGSLFLAADPNSNEMILVEQNTVKDIGSHVWNGTDWGNSLVLEPGTSLWLTRVFGAVYFGNMTAAPPVPTGIVINQTSPACITGAAYYPTIQQGIDAADPNNATIDTVYVCPGTYAEDVKVNKSIDLIGYGDKSQIIIDGADTAVSIEADGVYMSSFTIGHVSGLGHKYGLYTSGYNYSVIENIDILNISSSNGDAYGLYLNNANNNNMTIGKINSVHSSPSTTSYAYGLYIDSSDNNSINDLINISNITARTISRGIYLTGSSNNTINNNNIVISYLGVDYTSAFSFAIELASSSDNNIISGIGSIHNIGYMVAGYKPARTMGIKIDSSNNNTLIGNGTADISDILSASTPNGNYARGISLTNSDYNNITGFEIIDHVDTIQGGSISPAYGIYLDSSNNNSIDGIDTIRSINGSSQGGFGIYLSSSSDNVVSGGENIVIDDVSGINDVRGIYLYLSNRNVISGLGNMIISYGNNPIKSIGIDMVSSDHNRIIGNGSSMIHNISSASTPTGQYSAGIHLSDSDYNNITGIRNITNITAYINSAAYGIFLENSDYNTIKDPTISNLTGGSAGKTQFRSDASSNYNTIHATFTPNPTQTRFVQYSVIGINGISTLPTDPGSYTNISKYVDIPGYASDSWIFLNITYTDQDLIDANVSESSLEVWKKPAGAWTTNTGTATKGVDLIGNYVYANISNFGSVFAPLGTEGVDVPPIINLISPANGTITINTTLNFTCEGIDDENLENITLYIWNSTGGIFYQNSTNLSGTYNTSTLEVSGFAGGDYTWNCFGYDNESQSDWGDNWTLQIFLDVLPPAVTLISPPDEFVTNNGNMLFVFRVTDNYATTLNCSLYDNKNDPLVFEFDKSALVSQGINTFSSYFANGWYKWNVECTDEAGNSAFFR